MRGLIHPLDINCTRETTGIRGGLIQLPAVCIQARAATADFAPGASYVKKTLLYQILA